MKMMNYKIITTSLHRAYHIVREQLNNQEIHTRQEKINKVRKMGRERNKFLCKIRIYMKEMKFQQSMVVPQERLR